MTWAISGRESDPVTMATLLAPPLQSGPKRPLAEVVTDADATHVERIDWSVIAAAVGRQATGITLGTNQLERLLELLRMLQASEEFRHYWQARVMRLFRLLAANEMVSEAFGLDDYLEAA